MTRDEFTHLLTKCYTFGRKYHLHVAEHLVTAYFENGGAQKVKSKLDAMVANGDIRPQDIDKEEEYQAAGWARDYVRNVALA